MQTWLAVLVFELTGDIPAIEHIPQSLISKMKKSRLTGCEIFEIFK